MQIYLQSGSDLPYAVYLSLPFSSQNVVWSSPQTCESQILALKACGMSVCIGNTYRDIDERDDLRYLLELFTLSPDNEEDSLHLAKPILTLQFLKERID